MKALEVLVNGKRFCVAGSPKDTTFVNVEVSDRDNDSEKPPAGMCIAGRRGKMVVTWDNDFVLLNTGDEIRIKIVDVAEADPPVASSPAWTEFPRVKLD